MKKILFFAECITLAHLGRIYALAESLDGQDYDIGLAADNRYDALISKKPWARFSLETLSTGRFTLAASKGRLAYTAEDFSNYVESDLDIMDRFKPDLVVGDFRLSLGISARLRNIPYLNVVNAYWSPYSKAEFKIPELIPVTRIFGERITQPFFNLARPVAFAANSMPFNKTRKKYGLKPLPADLQHIYTDGDFTLYADIPEMVPVFDQQSPYRYIGPVNWSAHAPLPSWWDEIPADRTAILVSLGTSGDNTILPELLRGLSGRKEPVCVVTAGYDSMPGLPENFFFSKFMPMDKMLEKAGSVICNGGVMSYHALARGIPVLNIPRNIDQHLCTSYTNATGAGISLRSENVTSQAVSRGIARIIGEESFRVAAEKLGRQFDQYDYRKIFPEILSQRPEIFDNP
jgi:UDP:flavonoid glycosyltransferase YjiC (YdhE family)